MQRVPFEPKNNISSKVEACNSDPVGSVDPVVIHVFSVRASPLYGSSSETSESSIFMCFGSLKVDDGL